MWKRLRGWISGRPDPTGNARSPPPSSSAAAPPVLVTLRNVEVARQFPQDLPDATVGLPADEPHACASCRAALKRVIITTGGPLGDPAVWEAYPLALDGWQCERCEELTFPAFLSPDEIQALLGELLCRRAQPAEGSALLKQVLQSPDVPARLRDEAEALLQSVDVRDERGAP